LSCSLEILGLGGLAAAVSFFVGWLIQHVIMQPEHGNPFKMPQQDNETHYWAAIPLQ
jgi:hypothetical protein